MKILLVNFVMDAHAGGGTAERTRHLALHLKQAGYDCEILSISGESWQEEFKRKGIKQWTTGCIGRRFPLPLFNPWRIAKSIKQSQMIYITGYWNLLTIGIAFVARCCKKPYLLSPAGEFASFEKLKLHKRIFHFLFGKHVIKKARRLIAITPLERAQIAAYSGRKEAEIPIIPNGIASNPSKIIQEFPLINQPFILFMGRLNEIKGPDLLLQAFLETPLLHDYHLIFAGPDSGMLPILEGMLKHSALKNKVHFIGFVNEGQRNYLYQKALLLVIPSRSEAMSLVALEAGISGLPVLLTSACGLDDLADINEHFLVEPNVRSLAAALKIALSEQDKLPLMGQQWKEAIEKKYHWDQIIRLLQQQFDLLLLDHKILSE